MSLYLAVKSMYPDIKDEEFMIYNDGTGEKIIAWTSTYHQPTDDEMTAQLEVYEFDQAVADKKAELEAACNQAILGRFTADVNGATYQFSNDTEAQSNFKDSKLLFDDGTVDAMAGGIVTWTAYGIDGKRCRIQLNKDTFKSVFIARVEHQNNNVSKLRDDLEAKVDAAKSVPDVQAITWDMSTPTSTTTTTTTP